jgi:hypothetical protein
MNPGINHPAGIYPTGPHVDSTVLSGELSTPVQHFCFFTVDQLLTLGNALEEHCASSSKKLHYRVHWYRIGATANAQI